MTNAIVARPPRDPSTRTGLVEGDIELLNHEQMILRLCTVIGARSIRVVAAETGSCSETVRRYLNGGSCSVEFVTRVCTIYGVSAEWIMFGRGSLRSNARSENALGQVSVTSLFAEIARRWIALEERAYGQFECSGKEVAEDE